MVNRQLGAGGTMPDNALKARDLALASLIMAELAPGSFFPSNTTYNLKQSRALGTLQSMQVSSGSNAGHFREEWATTSTIGDSNHTQLILMSLFPLYLRHLGRLNDTFCPNVLEMLEDAAPRVKSLANNLIHYQSGPNADALKDEGVFTNRKRHLSRRRRV